MNKKALFRIIWSQCSTTMQTRLKGLEEYEDKNRDKDSLWLLKEIRNISYKFEAQDYIYKSLHNAKQQFYKYKQKRNETNSEYLNNFKNIIDVIHHYGGRIGDDRVLVLHEMRREKLLRQSENEDKYKEGNPDYDLCTKQACQRYHALAFLESSDKYRYKELLDNLSNNYMKNIHNHPNNITTAYNMMVVFKSTTRKPLQPIYPHNQNHQRSYQFTNMGMVVCYNCDEEGHYANACPKPRNPNRTNFSSNKNQINPLPTNQKKQNNKTSNTGESAIQMLCAAVDDDDEDIGADFDWALGFMVMHNAEPNTNKIAPSSTTTTTTTEIILAQGGYIDPNWILLDSQSTVDLFSNKNLLSNIQETDG
jgi:hypothetical protein